ncbi:YjbQ family protein [bacterium]|nr:YjbQ family protein [bacterium]
MKELIVRSRFREEMRDITEEIERFVREEELRNGFVVLYVPHTTAGLVINEGFDPDVSKDLIEMLKRLIPKDGNYRHAEGNSDAHIKSTILGESKIIPVKDGKLLLGTWQRIFFFEGDGPRNRRVILGAIHS